MAKYNLRINGNAQRVDSSDADKPLLYVLRGLKLTATKFGCGLGQCGACTVLIEGAAVRSCQMPASRTRRASRSSHSKGLDLQTIRIRCRAAFINEQVPQCGYCTSGMIMSAAALLSDKQKAERSRHSLGARWQSLPLRVSRAGGARGHGGVRTARLT